MIISITSIYPQYNHILVVPYKDILSLFSLLKDGVIRMHPAFDNKPSNCLVYYLMFVLLKYGKQRGDI